MNNTPKSQDYIVRRVATALVAVMLLVGAALLVTRLSSGPSVLASGHLWVLYPSTGDSPEPDSSSEQEKLAFDGNVKLFSLLYIEDFTNGKSEILEALCHVLVDLPPKAVLRVTGGGGSDADNFDNYRTAKVIIQQEGEETPLEVEMKIRFRLSDRRLAISVGGETFDGYADSETGNVFVVRIDGDGNADGVTKSGERIPRQIDAEDVERLMKQVDAGE